MKRYLVFAGIDYYPAGGWNDFQGSFASLNEANVACLRAEAEKGKHGDGVWFHIVDTENEREL